MAGKGCSEIQGKPVTVQACLSRGKKIKDVMHSSILVFNELTSWTKEFF